MVATKKMTKEQQRISTRSKLISIAKELFSNNPYSDVSTEHIVSKAGVTRGALYHHFINKQDIFLAVFEEIQQDIASRIRSGASEGKNAWEELLLGCKAFLKACIDPSLRQIVVVDAPSVLGWNLWRDIDEKHGLQELKEALMNLKESNLIMDIDTEVLAYLLSGAMNEAAMWIVKSEDAQAALHRTWIVFEQLLEGIKK